MVLPKRGDFEGFEYVVERKKPDSICFGSRKIRNTDPIGKGLSPFQRMISPEVTPNIGPGYYESQKYNTAMGKMMNKVRSNKGFGPLVNGEPRFKDKIYMRTPSPSRYPGKDWSIVEQSRAPFGTKTRRMYQKERKIPGPGTYNIECKRCQKTRYMYNFGHPTMIPGIEIICISRPTHTCIKCEQICTGDYWHKDHTIYLCHLCWEEEKRNHEIYNQKELKTFRKIRNCAFAHKHEGTTAAIRVMPPPKVTKKLRLENYLDLYIHC